MTEKRIFRNMRRPKNQAAAAVCNGKLFICGGEEDAICVECFNPESRSWTVFTRFPTIPTHSWRCSLISYGNQLIVLEDSRAMQIDPLDLNKRRNQFPSWKSTAGYYTVVAHEKEIIAIGGSPIRSRVEIYNGKFWRDGPSLPPNWHSPFAVRTFDC